jgi:lipoate---protein ligase
MKQMRLLITEYNKGAWNMAVDEAVLESVSSGAQLPTLRLYGWIPRCVTIGYFQSLHEEVDVRACQLYGYDVVRRSTGGGAVFHDKEITYSFVIREDDGLIVRDILKSYEQISQGVIAAVKKLGLDARFVPLNDLIVNDKKFSGNAQTRKKKTILQHGTVLLCVNIPKMFSLLKVSDEKIRGKLITKVEERVTALDRQIGREVSFHEMQRLLIEGYAEALGVELTVGSLSLSERSRAEEIMKEKYANRSWNEMR